jgi:hypothetical protein
MNYFEQLNLIDKVLRKRFSKLGDAEKQVVQLISTNKSLRFYFFDNLQQPTWFPVLKKLGYFESDRNPKPRETNGGYQIPEWEVLVYLEWLSKKHSHREDLLKIIKDVSLYRDKKGEHIDNYRTWWYFVKILLNIPLSDVPYEIFDKAMPIWLTSRFDLTLPGSDLNNDLLPKYLNQTKNAEDVKKVERLVELLLGVKDIKTKKSVLGETLEVETKIDTHWLEESFITKNNASLIAQKCTNAPIFSLANSIRDIFSKKYKKEDYSSIWLRDLTKEQTKSIYNSEYFLAVILRKIAIEKVNHSKKDGNEIIERFLSEEYPHTLFKRLAIVFIAMDWDSYGKYFDQILGNEKESYFDRDAFKPEVAHLLRENVTHFTEEQKTTLNKIIESGPSRDLPDKKKEEYKIYWKQSLYRILDTSPEFKAKYEEIKKTTKKDVKLPEYNDGVVFREEFDKSPVSAEEFLKKENSEIVKYIAEYKPTGDFPNSSPEGIYRTFQSAVELDPIKITQNLTTFKLQDYHLLSSLYSGLEEAWKQKKDFSWENVIKFTLELLQEEWFWNPTEKDRGHHYDYFSWTLSAIGDLIEEGCRTDEWAFSEELHADIEKILGLLVEKMRYDDDSYQGDGVSHALNSRWGKALTALIYLGLREARLSDKKGEEKKSKWSNSLKEIYEKALEKGIFEAYTLLGQYLPNLHYIDKDWTESQAKKIHTIEDDIKFEAFMEGYLFTGKVYEKLYKLLTNSYIRALTLSFKDKRIQERLIQHITVGYIRGNEKLEKNSLIDEIIKAGKPGDIREIVEFMWHQKDYITAIKTENEQVEKEKEEFRKRILTFWDYILNTLNKKKDLTEEEKKVLSELGKFAIYLPELNEDGYKRLHASAPYVTVDFDSPYFIEYLNKLKDIGDKTLSANYVGKLYLEMLHGYTQLTPDYKWDNVVEIVTHLYEVGKSDDEVKNLANNICIFYAEHRNLRLREIYEKYNAVSA